MLRILRNLLGQLHFTNIDEGVDGAEALQNLRKDNFVLVISDWNMESMTGTWLLREVRADAKRKHIPFIMITAVRKLGNVIAAKEPGVSSGIAKPFNAGTLKFNLARVLGEFWGRGMAQRKAGSASPHFLQELREKPDGAFSVGKVADSIERLMAALKGGLAVFRSKLLIKLNDLSDFIRTIKGEIPLLSPYVVKHEYLSKAADELDKIVAATADAKNSIMDATEIIEAAVSAVDGETRDQPLDATARIYEACGFQDITSQRITKVVGRPQEDRNQDRRFVDRLWRCRRDQETDKGHQDEKKDGQNSSHGRGPFGRPTESERAQSPGVYRQAFRQFRLIRHG